MRVGLCLLITFYDCGVVSWNFGDYGDFGNHRRVMRILVCSCVYLCIAWPQEYVHVILLKERERREY